MTGRALVLPHPSKVQRLTFGAVVVLSVLAMARSPFSLVVRDGVALKPPCRSAKYGMPPGPGNFFFERLACETEIRRAKLSAKSYLFRPGRALG